MTRARSARLLPLLVLLGRLIEAPAARADLWVPASGVPSGEPVALAIDPSTPTTLYQGTVGGGVFRSTDGGNTWTPAGLANRVVRALAIDPSTPTTLYAGTGGGVFRSTDAGASWTALGLTDLHTQVEVLAIDPVTPTTLYAGTFDAETFGGAVFRSTNSGNSWTAVLAAPRSFVLSLAIDPATPTTLYAGTSLIFAGGVFRSTDGGNTWSPASTGLANLGVSALAIDPSTATTLYAGTDRGVFRSIDGGNTWSPASTGLGILAVIALAIDPATPTTLYAGTAGGGVFRSVDGGNTWIPASAGLGILDVTDLAIDPVTPTTLYAAGATVSPFTGSVTTGVFRSTDGGNSWTAMNTGLTNLVVYAFAIDPTRPSTLYAATSGGVFRQVDVDSDELTDEGEAALGTDPRNPDTDGDAALDGEDDCARVADPAQLDTDGDGFGNACDCDFDQDGRCGVGDFNLFLDGFRRREDPGNGIDMDGDGSVGIGDFNLFLDGFKAGAPGPSALAR